MERFGFVYIWRDRKYNKYYIGSHWGLENDGYVCSNSTMKTNHQQRSEDFKRRIIAKIHIREDLLKEEQRFLDMIKPEEFGIRYYNVNSSVNSFIWWNNPTTKKMIGNKIKEKLLGRTLPKETRQKMAAYHLGRKRSTKAKQTMSEVQSLLKVNLGRKHSSKAKEKISKARLGIKLSDETKQKMSDSFKVAFKNRKFKNVTCPHCDLTSRGPAMTRYHFNNCKQK